MDDHKAQVSAIESKVRGFHEAQRPFRVYHGSTNSTRDSKRNLDDSIDTSKLTRILQVDKQRKTALAECNVPMDELLLASMEHSLVPLIVMEFPGCVRIDDDQGVLQDYD